MGNITIIQPGRLGDLLLVLPIAYYYYSQGLDVTWPIANEYIDVFKNVNFLSHMFIYNIGSIDEKGHMLRTKSWEYITQSYIDLAIGFGNPLLDKNWKETNLSFDLWKYKHAGLPYTTKYDLYDFIVRNRDKESQLMALKEINKNDNYIVVHEDGSHGRHFDFNKIIGGMSNHYGIVRLGKVEGYNIFDWLSILQGAFQIYCVDSCFANLVDQYGIIPRGGRFFHPWSEYYTPLQLKLLTPKISDDWKIIT
ncbi:MAG: hypothetical protein ACFFDY_00155 [Candidatus Thorarchaeota archaeon]